jgi:cell division septum initiation protein DivIVA
VAAALIHHIDVASRTTTPGWDFLMERAKVGRSTLKKALAWLRAHGFLATVASGRKGIYAQKGSDGHELWPSKTGERTNERAVYVLCEPLSPEALASEEQHAADVAALVASTAEQFDVDITRPPIPTSVGTNPPHARESQCEKPKAENDGATHRLKSFYEARSARVQALGEDRIAPLWPAKATTNAGSKRATRANELVAALTLRNDNFALRPLSGKHLAYLFRPFFEADWLIGDIKHAFDTKPDGTKHRHDGFDGARNVADLIAYRLSFWMENGVVTYSYSQRYMKRSQDARQRAIEYARMMEQRQKEVTKPKVSVLSDVAREALRRMRELFH